MYKNFRGMSTKEVQKKWGKLTLTTSEGISKNNKIEYTLSQWVDNFSDYLRSAMSYTDSKNLEEFRDSEIVFISQNALKRFDK
jgi:ABC-type long-subunit fatty acid transport system fused permease/ATPase subunit